VEELGINLVSVLTMSDQKDILQKCICLNPLNPHWKCMQTTFLLKVGEILQKKYPKRDFSNDKNSVPHQASLSPYKNYIRQINFALQSYKKHTYSYSTFV